MATYPTILAGQRVTASLFASALPIMVVKQANEVVNNSNTLQNDNELFLAVEANGIYLVESFLIYSSATAADFLLDFAMPTGATLQWEAPGLSTAAADFTSVFVGSIATDGADYNAGGLGTSTSIAIRPYGLLAVSSTAGNLQIRWSQRTANASDTTVYAKSWMKLTRYA